MKIKNTDHSYCKVKDVKISGLKAYITLIVYSSAPQTSQDNLGNIDRVFSFYLRDLNSDELHKLSHNNYWIDRTHNYNNEGINIDINMYKEIILEVDPLSERTANLLSSSLVALIISFIASACIKSIFPFKYARLENSPLFAILAPFFIQVLIILFMINIPP